MSAIPLDPLRSLALGLSLLGAAASAGAQAGLYVNLQPAVLGESVAVLHKDWIEAYSFQFGVGAGISSVPGGRREASKPNFSEITWTQGLDTSVPQLLGQSLKSNPVMASAQIDQVLPVSAASNQPNLRYTLGNAVLTGVNLANTSVSASLGYQNFTLDYDRNDKSPERTTFSYDLVRRAVTEGKVSRSAKAVTSDAATAEGIYLRLGSGSQAIAGDHMSKGYENWIGLDAYQFGVGLAFNPATGMFSRPSVSELTFVQGPDSSVPYALAALASGSNIGQATIEYVRHTSNGPVTFMQLVLDDVLLSGLTLSSGGGTPSVSESINFGKFMQTVWEVDSAGQRSNARTVAYDLGLGRPIPGFQVLSTPNFGPGNLVAAAPGPSPLPSPVPEPASAVLMLAGVALLLVVRRRRAAPEAG